MKFSEVFEKTMETDSKSTQCDDLTTGENTCPESGVSSILEQCSTRQHLDGTFSLSFLSP